MEDGLFQRVQMPTFAENPTLTGCNLIKSQPFFYCIPSDVLPFTGWDYIEVKKFKYTNSLITMYGAYVEHILRMVVKKLHNEQVRFQIVLCDCMNIQQYIEPATKYDRILTSNLMDYIILPDLLKVCSEKLNRANPFATIVTETQNWARDFYPEAGIVDDHIDIATQMELCTTSRQDTKNNKRIMNSDNDVREYIESSRELIDFLRALFYSYATRNEFRSGYHSTDKRESQKVPTLKALGNEFRLQHRDCFRNENRIAPFKMAVNRRRVTMINGLERILEWIPLQSE